MKGRYLKGEPSGESEYSEETLEKVFQALAEMLDECIKSGGEVIEKYIFGNRIRIRTPRDLLPLEMVMNKLMNIQSVARSVRNELLKGYRGKISDPFLYSILIEDKCPDEDTSDSREGTRELLEYSASHGMEYGCLKGMEMYAEFLKAYSESVDRILREYKEKVDEKTFRLIEKAGKCLKKGWERDREIIITELENWGERLADEP